MEFVNESGLQAGWTLGFERDGRELLVVVVKATYAIPEDPAKEPVLADEQVPLTEADEFTGEPGLSAIRYETDYAHRKPKCDVLLNGSAYSPTGRPTKRVDVEMSVGSVRKSFDVLGNRVWDRTLLLTHPTDPVPFESMPISYDCAYGGADVHERKPDKCKTYLHNPVGAGYYPLTKGKALVGKPLANTAQTGVTPTKTNGKYKPMAFGPIGRNFRSRYPLAGTYDKPWFENRAPFWPDDFDYAYFQAAPVEQQTAHLQGGEEVVLRNLTPEGITIFRIPHRTMAVGFVAHRGRDERVHAACDTLVIEPEDSRFTLTWRAAYALRRNMFELDEVVVGARRRNRSPERKWKRKYANLQELVQARRGT
jgi:hypothetical protein